MSNRLYIPGIPKGQTIQSRCDPSTYPFILEANSPFTKGPGLLEFGSFNRSVVYKLPHFKGLVLEPFGLIWSGEGVLHVVIPPCWFAKITSGGKSGNMIPISQAVPLKLA